VCVCCVCRTPCHSLPLIHVHTLQRTATTLQHTAALWKQTCLTANVPHESFFAKETRPTSESTHCNVLQLQCNYTATTLQHTAKETCHTNKCVVSHGWSMFHTWMHHATHKMCCSVWHGVVLYCSVLQCIAVCCSVSRDRHLHKNSVCTKRYWVVLALSRFLI